jgi:hypothetical protein
MGNEKKLVVNPLKRYFLNKKRSGATWLIKDEPSSETAATGWDLQMKRNKQVLLIEAKYFSRSFISSFGGLITSPLTNRPEKMKSNKRRSWSAVVCWAIGSGYKNRDIYQIIFDYFVRNLEFWPVYSKVLKVKYIYFVSNNKVGKIRFDQIIKKAILYRNKLINLGIDIYGRKDVETKRIEADKLMKDLKFK